jgi:protein SCO1/2
MSRKLIAALAAVTVAALVGGTLGYVQMKRGQDPFADCRGSGIASAGAIGGPFTLMDEQGKPFTEKDLAAKPALVYFGYSFCPDVCPLDNTRNAEAVDLLAKMGLDVTPVFISVDPDRDTPQVMAEFTDAMHPKMIGLTGTAEQVKAAANAYKVYYKKQDTGDQYYTMDHSTFTYLMLPGAGFVDFFNRDDTAQQMADRTACFLGKG